MTDRAFLMGGLLGIAAFALTFGHYWRHGSWIWEAFLA